MKKSIAFFLSLTALLCLFTACGEELSQTLTETQTATAQTEAEPAITPVPVPFDPQKLYGLPVADSEMTEEELRDLCVNYFLMQGTIPWKTKQSFLYDCHGAGNADENGNLHFEKGVLYGGLPYTRASSNLYTWLEYYDPETGFLDVSGLKNNVGTVLGNNCSDAVFWAWARVSTTISFTGTGEMTTVHGCIPLGDYEVDTTLDANRETKNTCRTNGEAKMYECYALLKKADAVETTNTEGHTMMCTEDAHVERVNGVIDPNKSYITVIEQHSSFKNLEIDGMNVKVQSGAYNTYTFKEIFNKGYIPVTIAELAGKKDIEKAWAKTDLPGDCTTAAIDAAKLTANYRLSKIIITFTNADGSVAATSVYHPSESYMYEIPLSKASYKTSIRSLKKGTAYGLKIEVLLANGETLVAYEGNFTA